MQIIQGISPYLVSKKWLSDLEVWSSNRPDEMWSLSCPVFTDHNLQADLSTLSTDHTKHMNFILKGAGAGEKSGS